jgi:CheY-like chemotaxis protein
VPAMILSDVMMAGWDDPVTASSVQAGRAGQYILIVEDNLDVLRLLTSLMAEEGYEILPADTAERARTLLEFFTADAVLMDIGLPGGMDGLELTRLIKSTRVAKSIPVIAVSAADTAIAIQQAYEAGCDGYITKPVDIRTFAANIRQYLDRP